MDSPLPHPPPHPLPYLSQDDFWNNGYLLNVFFCFDNCISTSFLNFQRQTLKAVLAVSYLTWCENMVKFRNHLDLYWFFDFWRSDKCYWSMKLLTFVFYPKYFNKEHLKLTKVFQSISQASENFDVISFPQCYEIIMIPQSYLRALLFSMWPHI